MIRGSGLFEIFLIISFQYLPDPDRERNLRLFVVNIFWLSPAVRGYRFCVSLFGSDERVKRSYCELPFVVTLFSGTRITGKIDRLCELSDGSWVVIDYKSEASADYAALAEDYTVSL